MTSGIIRPNVPRSQALESKRTNSLAGAWWLPLGVACVMVAVLMACGDGSSSGSEERATTANESSAGESSTEESATESSTSNDGDPNGAEASTGSDPDEPAFRSAEQCGKCHTEIYNEWKASFHGRAMSDPLFLDMMEDVVNPEECIRCHAPIPLREADFDTPIARTARRADAVSCLTCHQSGGNVAGPFGGLSGACRPVGDEAQRSVSKMCFPCHNQHDTGNEWLGGPWSPEAPDPRQAPSKSCLDCHMPEVERPLVKGGPVRKGRRHTWPGGHSFAQLKRAAKLDVEIKKSVDEKKAGDIGWTFRVFVTNRGAGHSIPTDARHRSFDTYLKLWDDKGTVLLDPLNPRQQAKAHLATFRKYYRNSGSKDTQIAPLARVSTNGDGPGQYTLSGVKSGRGEAWLVYRLTPRDWLTKESLLADQGPDDIQDAQTARVVERVPFAFDADESSKDDDATDDDDMNKESK